MRSPGSAGAFVLFGMVTLSQESTQSRLSHGGHRFGSAFNDADKPDALQAARLFAQIGFRIRATAGSCAFLKAPTVWTAKNQKAHEGRPNILDSIATRS
jgi:carbamoyl-phosphate synthase large subunit